LHNYGGDLATGFTNALAVASQYQKRLIHEEFGATGANKASTLSNEAQTANQYGIPWMFWEILNPGAGAADYEVWTNEPSWSVLAQASESAVSQPGVFTWNEL